MNNLDPLVTNPLYSVAKNLILIKEGFIEKKFLWASRLCMSLRVDDGATLRLYLKNQRKKTDTNGWYKWCSLIIELINSSTIKSSHAQSYWKWYCTSFIRIVQWSLIIIIIAHHSKIVSSNKILYVHIHIKQCII